MHNKQQTAIQTKTKRQRNTEAKNYKIYEHVYSPEGRMRQTDRQAGRQTNKQTMATQSNNTKFTLRPLPLPLLNTTITTTATTTTLSTVFSTSTFEDFCLTSQYVNFCVYSSLGRARFSKDH